MPTVTVATCGYATLRVRACSFRRRLAQVVSERVSMTHAPRRCDAVTSPLRQSLRIRPSDTSARAAASFTVSAAGSWPDSGGPPALRNPAVPGTPLACTFARNCAELRAALLIWFARSTASSGVPAPHHDLALRPAQHGSGPRLA